MNNALAEGLVPIAFRGSTDGSVPNLPIQVCITDQGVLICRSNLVKWVASEELSKVSLVMPYMEKYQIEEKLTTKNTLQVTFSRPFSPTSDNSQEKEDTMPQAKEDHIPAGVVLKNFIPLTAFIIVSFIVIQLDNVSAPLWISLYAVQIVLLWLTVRVWIPKSNRR